MLVNSNSSATYACNRTLHHDSLFQRGTSSDVLRDIIETFSCEGDRVLDITGLSGESIPLVINIGQFSP